MILVLLVGGALGWWVRYVRLRREAFATIEAAEGYIAFADWEHMGRGWWSWLYDRTGIEAFREIYSVHFDPYQPKASGAGEGPPLAATVEALSHLGPIWQAGFDDLPINAAILDRLADARISNLRLGLYSGTALLDDALAPLSRLRMLEGLSIRSHDAALPGGILRAVGELPRLKLLNLGQTGTARPDRADLAALGRLTKLETLILEWASIDGADLGVLDAMPQLTGIALGAARPDDGALRRLVATHPRLRYLTVDGADLTDRGVAALADLPDLKKVRLAARRGGRGQLTDASLDLLGRIKGLDSLSVSCGRFTAVGLDALRGLRFGQLELGSIGPGGEAAIGRLLAGRSLSSVKLSGPGVTDAALADLVAEFGRNPAPPPSGPFLIVAGVKAAAPAPLQSLTLVGPGVTDAGLATLGAANLVERRLELRGTRATPAGVAAFKVAQPGVDISAHPEED